MAGNPKDSPWYATPRSKRNRVKLEVSLSPETSERLVTIAERRDMNRSAVVEELVAGCPLPPKKKTKEKSDDGK